MAGQTIRTKQWGWNVGGVGTDATAVTTGQTYVQRINVCSEASADTFTVADASGVVVFRGAAPVGLFNEAKLDTKLKGITVTMSSSVSRCNIFVI